MGGDTAQKNVNREGGTPHILPEQVDKRGGHRTSKFAHMFILGWGHRTSKFGHMFILGWGHHTKFQILAVGRVAGIW